jgi:photosystem II stability/assembly factor-like uncharacterized protein
VKHLKYVRIVSSSIVLSSIVALTPGKAAAQEGASGSARRAVAANPFGELTFRAIGPAVMGGRIHDVKALPGDPSTIIVASASGGLWKTTNHGTVWTPIFDDQPTSAFGVVAMAPSDHDVIWAGTGEQNNRQSTTWGDGVFRSTDGGKTWAHLGLEATRAIGALLVDPTNPDVAYVGALGNLWKATPERGVYKTSDGGRTWGKVLFVDTLTGVVDMVMDPENPNTLYAAAYERLRSPCCFNGGGPGSGIYKTTDGGAHWARLAGGLPTTDMGRIGLAISHTNGKRVYAVVENRQAGGVYRTEDGGDSWSRVSDLNPRPMYYSSLAVDPTNDERVYMMARYFYRSDDAGANWRTMPTEPTYDVGLKGDYHAMWIDPNDSRHFYLVGDGGLYESWDMGETYVRLNNIPISQFYGIGLDDDTPFNIYGGLQDDHSWFGPSATRHYLGIAAEDWREIGFNDGLQGYPDLAGRHFVFSNAVEGDLTRVDSYTGDRADIHPEPPPGQPPYRWEWITPGLASRHVKGTYYYGGNKLFITHDYGRTWHATKDLTRVIDRDTVTIAGVKDADITLSRNDGQGAFSAISAIDESPLSGRVLWVGTDDGNVQVSRDSGVTWTEVGHNVHGVPDGSYVSSVLASSAGMGEAYVAFDNHRRGDFAPYLVKTTDYGRSWALVSSGLPAEGSTRKIAEYPGHGNVLFLGTEHHLFVSQDGGAHWVPLGANLPTTLYLDIKVEPKTRDVVAATHGRSLWILDDAGPLVEWSGRVATQPAYVFSILPATIFQHWEDFSYRGQDYFAGGNPPDGAIIDYSLATEAPSASLTIADSAGHVIRTLEGPGEAGTVHRVVWDLRHTPPPATGPAPEYEQRALPRPPRPTTPQGPFVSPGKYTVTLKAGSATAHRTVVVRPDPKMAITLAQYRAREAFLVDLLDVQRKSAELLERVQGAARGPARRLQFQAYGLASNFNGRGAVQGTLYPPTAAQRRQLAELKQQLARLDGEGH